jgi:hypothetical protein
MSRSYKKTWKCGLENLDGMKAISNRKFRKIPLLDKNGDEVLFGKNTFYKKCAINTWDICDWKCIVWSKDIKDTWWNTDKPYQVWMK